MIRKTLLSLVLLLFGVISTQAQKREVILQQMEMIRQSPCYIYAEAESSNLDRAFSSARSQLQKNTNAWIAQRTGMEALKATLMDIDKVATWMNTKQNGVTHTFMYFKKSDFTRNKPKMRIKLLAEENGASIDTGKPRPVATP